MSGSLPDCSTICEAQFSPEMNSIKSEFSKSDFSTTDFTKTAIFSNDEFSKDDLSKSDLINSSISNLTAPISQENVAIPNTPTSDFFNLHGTVQTSLDKVTTKINSSYSTLSNFLQGQRQRLQQNAENNNTVESSKKFSENKNSSSPNNQTQVQSSSASHFPNADDVLQELDEYFKLEDIQTNPQHSSNSSLSLSTNIDFTQIGTDDSHEINLENLDIHELQKIQSNFTSRTHRINDHLVQALAQRDDESIKHEIYQGIINVINQLGVVYQQRSESNSVVYVPKDGKFRCRGIIELKKFLDLLVSIYENYDEDGVDGSGDGGSARLLAKYVLQCSENL